MKRHRGIAEGVLKVVRPGDWKFFRVSQGIEMTDKSRSANYRHPRTGEKRQSRQPLKIDRLPTEVQGAIIAARRAGYTWKETADAASAKAGMRLAASTVQRWFDLRIDQPEREASADTRRIVELLEAILQEVRA